MRPQKLIKELEELRFQKKLMSFREKEIKEVLIPYLKENGGYFEDKEHECFLGERKDRRFNFKKAEAELDMRTLEPYIKVSVYERVDVKRKGIK
jgi:hypothetical protein